MQSIPVTDLKLSNLQPSIQNNRPIVIQTDQKNITIYIQLYNGIYLIDDDGNTFADILNQNEKFEWQYRVQIHNILDRYQIRQPDDRLVTNGTKQNLISRIRAIVNAIIDIYAITDSIK